MLNHIPETPHLHFIQNNHFHFELHIVYLLQHSNSSAADKSLYFVYIFIILYVSPNLGCVGVCLEYLDYINMAKHYRLI